MTHTGCAHILRPGDHANLGASIHCTQCVASREIEVECQEIADRMLPEQGGSEEVPLIRRRVPQMRQREAPDKFVLRSLLVEDDIGNRREISRIRAISRLQNMVGDEPCVRILR